MRGIFESAWFSCPNNAVVAQFKLLDDLVRHSVLLIFCQWVFFLCGPKTGPYVVPRLQLGVSCLAPFTYPFVNDRTNRELNKKGTSGIML